MTPVFEAQHYLASQNSLGEGILWDSDAKVIRWVDIPQAEICSYDPVSKGYTVDSYPETKYLGAITLRKNKEDVIGVTHDAIAILPVSTPSGSQSVDPKSVQKTEQKIKKTITTLIPKSIDGAEIRLNDAGCDPAGRLFGGSMNVDDAAAGKGKLFRVEADGSSTEIFDGISCSNGLGWSPDGKTMYYIDSGKNEIEAHDFDLTTGSLSNKRQFAGPPASLDASKEPTGCYDGMTMDGQGNVWVARWKDGRVMGFRPDGSLIANIVTPGCLSPTIPCFGGENLDQMYIASANTRWAGLGDIQSQYPRSGDIFTLDFGPGSEIRKLLGEEWKGAERHRFGG